MTDRKHEKPIWTGSSADGGGASTGFPFALVTLAALAVCVAVILAVLQ